MKLSGPRAFRPVVMTVVEVVIAPFFVAIIIATWSGGRGGRSSAELLGTWSTWFVVEARRRSLVGSTWLAQRLAPWLGVACMMA